MARRQRNQGVTLMSLTPMIFGIATALAAVALLAFFVLPSRGEGNNTDDIVGTSIAAPDIAFEDDTDTPTPERTPKVHRVEDPLIIEPSATPSEVVPTETIVATATLDSLPGFSSTPRVLQPNPTEVEDTPTPYTFGEVPTAVPPRPPVNPPPPPPATATLQPTSGPPTPVPTAADPTSTPNDPPTIAPTQQVQPTPRPTRTPKPPPATATTPPVATETPVPTETATTEITNTPTVDPTATSTSEPTATPNPGSPTTTGTPETTRTPRGTRTVTVTITTTPNLTQTVTPEGSPPG